MKLKEIRIDRGYRKDGPLRGELKFTGITGDISLVMDETLSRRVINICADELVKASQSLAESMTAEIIEGQSLIEEKKQ